MAQAPQPHFDRDTASCSVKHRAEAKLRLRAKGSYLLITVRMAVVVGIDSGQSLQLQGEGGAAALKEGTPGNLFVEVSIAADPVLRRQGPHIHVSIDVDFVDAILGNDAK